MPTQLDQRPNTSLTSYSAANRYFEDVFQHLPANTKRTYISHLNAFNSYCLVNQKPTLCDDMLNNEQILRDYAITLCESTFAYTTIKQRLSTISKFLKIIGLPNPLIQSETLRDLIRLTLRKHQIYNQQEQAPALTIEYLEVINDNVIPDRLLDIRDLAMVNMMFDGLLRASDLQRVQLQEIDFQKQTLHVQRSKNDQEGKGSYRFLSRTTLAYLSDYISEANLQPNSELEKSANDNSRINKGIVFRALSPKGTSMRDYNEAYSVADSAKMLNYSTIYRAVKRICKKAGIDTDFSAHSMRVGAAVTLLQDGATIEELQNAGNWESPVMPIRYTQQARAGMGAMARLSKNRKR